jgi:hypothetical protein
MLLFPAGGHPCTGFMQGVRSATFFYPFGRPRSYASAETLMSFWSSRGRSDKNATMELSQNPSASPSQPLRRGWEALPVCGSATPLPGSGCFNRFPPSDVTIFGILLVPIFQHVVTSFPLTGQPLAVLKSNFISSCCIIRGSQNNKRELNLISTLPDVVLFGG